MARLKEKALLCALFLSFMFLLNIGAPILASQSSQTVSSHGTINYTVSGISLLHTSGTKIYDSYGNEVKLWGCVTIFGGGSQYTSTDFDLIKSWGFNLVRLEIPWCQLAPNSPTTIDTTNLVGSPFNIDNQLDLATKAGLYVSLMIYGTSWWHLPNPGYKSGYLPTGTIGVTDSGGSFSFTNSIALQAMRTMYGFLADRYYKGNNPKGKIYDNLIFEGINEMYVGSTSEITNFRSWNDNWVTAVENNEGATRHLKFIQFMMYYNGGGPETYWNFDSAHMYINGAHSNVVLATHSYQMIKQDGWVASLGVNEVCKRVYEECTSAGRPWMDTEFSWNYEGGGNFNNLDSGCAAMTLHGISGWGYFCYDGPSGSDYGNSANLGNPNNSYRNQILNVLEPYM